MQKDLEVARILRKVPNNLPVFLNMLTTAGHLHAGGYGGVQENSLHNDGYPGRALIFAPVFVESEIPDKPGGHLSGMFEVRFNVLLTMQEAAEQCNVNYRTIQRWRDEKKIPEFMCGDRPLFPSQIIQEFADKQGRRGRRAL